MGAGKAADSEDHAYFAFNTSRRQDSSATRQKEFAK
jgi:hypothetical protein